MSYTNINLKVVDDLVEGFVQVGKKTSKKFGTLRMDDILVALDYLKNAHVFTAMKHESNEENQ